jgi:hypothetical protein
MLGDTVEKPAFTAGFFVPGGFDPRVRDDIAG